MGDRLGASASLPALSAEGAKKRSTADYTEGTDLRDRKIIILNDLDRESSKEQHGRHGNRGQEIYGFEFS